MLDEVSCILASSEQHFELDIRWPLALLRGGDTACAISFDIFLQKVTALDFVET